MESFKVPEGYQTVMPYLVIKNADSFLNFTKKVFDGKEKQKHMRDETVIMHAEVMIGDSTIMIADSTENFEVSNAGLFVYVKSADETYELALNEGATTVMPLSDQSYGRTCGVKDPFGNVWWITSAP